MDNELLQSLIIGNLDIGLPSVLQNPDDTINEILTDLDDLDIHRLDMTNCIIPRNINLESCFFVDTCQLGSTIVVEHDPITGKLLGYKEEFLQDIDKSSKNSTSMLRQPDMNSEGIRGSTTNFPFWPGGFDEPNFKSLCNDSSAEIINLDKDHLNKPPGFEFEINFEKKNLDWLSMDESKCTSIYLTDLFDQDFHFINQNINDLELLNQEKSNEEEFEVIPDMVLQVDKKDFKQNDLKKEEFAIMVDVQQPVKDFRKIIPHLAIEYPFELDIFQKQAILHMENNQNVFVAAHTSAGKTVVAEYAIALAINHKTKAIYTSPIKALSNQKFRDFKDRFGDVGIITGDVQIKPESNVLVMTTEILRSMLYNGSDVIRDLEWAIFDEVHYINDEDRGVVWEEVFILLPQQVKIVMLSATVPNTREFAEWIGRTKRKKVYVISTHKRPVPLEHYLYTGNSSKTCNELFLLLDSNKNFITDGYKNAVNAKKIRASKNDQAYGSKKTKLTVNPKQEQQIWSSLITSLEKKDKLPAVTFIFSKKRIDENADRLVSCVDLLSSSEKSSVITFFDKSIKVLKPPDRVLPQILSLRNFLQHGIGIHHSGVLPILKEIVEMLFQRGLVKVLFATETFAMGVNMPAKTVIFDSIQKHVKEGLRELHAGEYIQMAGRAGRRGLDATGTVIILCKNEIPEISEFNKMMMGLPMTLHSQFRITYSMIINLLRVEQIRAEDMMRRSFIEFSSQKDSDLSAKKLEKLLEKQKQMLSIENETKEYKGFTHSSDISKYYEVSDELYKLKEFNYNKVYSQHYGAKVLVPGRIIVMEKCMGFANLAGIILGTISLSKEKKFKVLTFFDKYETDQTINSNEVINNKNNSNENNLNNTENNYEYPQPAKIMKLFLPKGSIEPRIVDMKVLDFASITSVHLKINADLIIDDFKKREIPRFSNDLPSQSTILAVQELIRQTESNSMNGFIDLDPIKDLHVKDFDVVTANNRIKFLNGTLCDFECVHNINFQEEFQEERRKRKLEEEIENLKYNLSDQSLILLPEYHKKVKVLKALGYIDNSNIVQLKGRIACEISTQELIITELLFDNMLNTLEPQVIASLLSAIVFQQKHCSKPNLNKKLKEVKDKFEFIALRLGELQKQYNLPVSGKEYLEEFNFNLMEVVYEWAMGMSFAEITQLTDVQEGVIVKCIQRLSELFKDLGRAAKLIGDPVLANKVLEASGMIKRDIVFAASLYLQ